MKAVKSTRFSSDEFAGEAPKRGTKLAPNKKSGKERHHLYRSLEEEDDDEQIDDYTSHQRESALDYFDDGQEDFDEDDFDDEDYLDEDGYEKEEEIEED